MVLDYYEHFWGDKHIGYHVLYENLKKGEDAVHELGTFVKERINMEDDLLRFLNKSLSRVNNYASANGAFVDTWRLTKGTLELWSEIQNSAIKNLSELSKDIVKYHDDLVKSRKRVKEIDVLDAVNLMQTTTTCLQKAKETYMQRCAEVANMKSEAGNSKEYIKAKSKMSKAHEEYKTYVEKYNQIRDTFEDKMLKASKAFQAHDNAHLLQVQKFFIHLAKSLDDSHNAISQVTTDYRQNLEKFDVESIMIRFVQEKGTGMERPQPIQWTEADELPADLDIMPNGSQSAPSSSNSSAVVSCLAPDNNVPTVNDLLGIGETSWNSHAEAQDHKSGDSDSESGGLGAASINSHSSYVPQFSSWLGRQKITQWRKKHSASQSNLPTSTSDQLADFSASYNDGSPASTSTAQNSAGVDTLLNKGNFLRRYRKSKNSTNDLTTMNETKDYLQTEDNRSTASSSKSDEKTPVHFGSMFGNSGTPATDPFSFLDNLGPPPPVPSSEPPPLFAKDAVSSFGSDLTPTNNRPPPIDSEGFSVPQTSQSFVHANKKEREWAYSSSSEDDEEEFKASKIKSLQIKPINESRSNINVSVDELRNAIGHITLQRSSTFDKDPWSTTSEAPGPFSQSLNISAKPLRAALTGDEHLRRKYSEMDFALPPTGMDFSQSSTENSFGAGSTIARARPRSHTPTANILQSTSLSTIATSSSSLGKSFEKSQKDSDNKPPKPAMPPTSLNGKGSMGSLGNIAAATMNDSAFAGPSSSSPLTIGSAGVSTILQQNRRQKLPIALALNEYVHVWMKGEDASSSVVRVFGTIMMSLPLSTLAPLSDQTANEGPLKFSVKNAREIKAILPNKKLIQTDGTLKCPNSSYSFSIDRKVIANWLAEQQKAKPESTFHNVDLVRYELSSESFSAPLFYTAYWKTEPLQTDLRVDYKLNTDNKASTHNALLNIVLSTPINGTFDSLNSVPEAKWNQENQTLTWTLTELSKHGECNGSLKARIKLLEGPSTPANTSVQFQIMDSSMAKLEVCLDSDESFTLSMVRRKIIAGKYFCEPEVR